LRKVLPHIRISLMHLFCLALFIIIFYGCCTQTDRFVNRAYHTVNAKYNGYFNAKESYKQGLERLANSHQDNFEDILHIFQYGTEQDAQSIESNLETAIEKSSIVIQQHSMNIDGEELNKWIDDAYFLIARCHFFKRDYHLAILSFEYIIRQFDTPLQYDSRIWIAKTNNYMGRFNNSRQALDILETNYRNGKIPEESKRLYYLVNADFYYKQAKYEEAIPYMEKAIESTRWRRDKTRMAFILGQTYHETGDFLNAQKYYAKTLRFNPDFDMEFRSKINMAMAYDPNIGGGSELKQQLYDMLEQERNKDYRDQIYYALAKFHKNMDMMDDAIDYFKKSIEVSETNNIQKGISSLDLGQIYYKREDYYEAQPFYDNAANFLPEDYANKDNIIRTSDILNDLAMNIKLIHVEDSLQHLASLPAAERNRIIDDIIAEKREEAQREREREREMMRAGHTRRDDPSQMYGEERGGWYFYNPSAVNFGQREFATRWGDRNLEDLWRIGGTGAITSADAIAEGEMSEIEEEQEQDIFSRETYLNGLPLDEEQIKVSNERIINAYYNKGIIYKDNLNNNRKAIDAFVTLNERFPKNEFQLYSYYFLHDIYSKTGNNTKATTYKNKIIEQYPESDYAQILSDPNYVENFLKRQNQKNELYKKAYSAYTNKNYDRAIRYCYDADNLELDIELAGKFEYLKALAYGYKGEKDKLSEILNNIVSNYHGTNVYDPAKNILAHLNDGQTAKVKETPKLDDAPEKDKEDKKPKDKEDEKDKEKDEFESIYEYNPNNNHFFVFIVNIDKIEIQELRSKINDFNKDAYSERNLSLSNIYFEDKKQILTVTSFQDRNNAERYLDKIHESNILSIFDDNYLKPFTISVNNYPIFYQNKNIQEYLEFYNHYYR